MAVQIISETPISAYQLKLELDKIKKRDKELNFRASKTEEHLIASSVRKNLDQLFEKISKMDIPRLKDQQIRKIIDIMPVTIKDLKVVLQGYNVSISNENMKKIADAVADAAK